MDLVGSTAHKQTPIFPLSIDASTWPDGALAPPWLSVISDFFSQFGNVFKEEWEAFCVYAEKNNLPTGDSPQLWKANGDELIYVKELTDRREVFGCIDAWVRAVQAYRVELKKRGSGALDIKCTCWFAGFPITNSEVVFFRDVAPTDTMFSDDSRLRQLHLREQWYSEPANKNALIRDFIGPSIDTGFRLATQATPRKMVLSVDVAYLLATSQLPKGSSKKKRLNWFNVAYEGRVILRGALRGKPYPLFWIDMATEEPIVIAEDKLIGSVRYCSEGEIEEFCSLFYEEFENLMFVPFLFSESKEQYGKMPENYEEFIVHLQARWDDEKARYKSETEEVSTSDQSGQILTKKEIDDFGKGVPSRK